ncbi:MAG: hypothetical protein IKL82_00610 [Clostridia bacterium]|nr:hypothetical protein [Clostridia bacterium]
MSKRNYNEIDSSLKPLSPWAYFGWSIVYSIPVVGIIALLINALTATNINCKNYARSFFCAFIIIVVLIIFLSVVAGPYLAYFIEAIVEAFESMI